MALATLSPGRLHPKQPAAQLLAWRYIRNDNALVVVTVTGSLVVTIEHDEGSIQLSDNVDATLADELIADIARHDANIHGAPATSKYDASLKVPRCVECNDEGSVWDEDLSGREQRYACGTCDPDGSGLEDARNRFEEREQSHYDLLADEAADRLMMVGL